MDDVPYTRVELKAMQRDLLADQKDIEASLLWVEAELAKRPERRRYRRVTAEEVRDYMVANGRHDKRWSPAALAQVFGCSENTMRSRLRDLAGQGILILCRVEGLPGIEYTFDQGGTTRPVLKSARGRQKGSRGKARGTSRAVAHTGKQNERVRRRRGVAKGTGGRGNK